MAATGKVAATGQPRRVLASCEQAPFVETGWPGSLLCRAPAQPASGKGPLMLAQPGSLGSGEGCSWLLRVGIVSAAKPETV